jgi:orotate phosphoribosyltransferase
MIAAEQLIAEKLLDIQAVKLNIENPYTWASGWKSPIYCDNRKALSYPFVRDFIKSEMSAILFEKFADAESVAGVATAGISWGAMAADQLKLPFIYVRPKPKEHGLSNQIEGSYTAGQKIVVIEDLVSTGKSSLQVCEVLKKEGLQIEGMISIFTYGFKEAADAFANAGIKLIPLCNYETLIEVAKNKNIISATDLEHLKKWSTSPANWGK